MTDPIAYYLTSLRNAIKANHRIVEIPASNLKKDITKVLFDKGFKKVYVVTDGFEGGTLKAGDKKSWRLNDGWKNSGLPWSYKLNKEKMYYKETF